jgi:type I restriction enzyme S subunit
MAGTVVTANDLLFNITGASIGRCAAVPADFDEANVSQHVTIIRPVLSALNPFLHTVLISRLVQQAVMEVQVGVSREGLSIAKLGNFLVPIPPLQEQARIVARVADLMRLCDALEAKGRLEAEQHARLLGTLLGTLTDSSTPEELAANWQRVADHFDLLLDRPEAVDALEQTIVKLAVRGLLVRQDPSDEPAALLLAQVRAEKDQLIADGKIKRDKILPEVDAEMAPFALPRGWAWARFPELGEFGRGKSKHRPRNDPALFNPPIYPLVQTGEVARAKGTILEYHSKYSELGLAQSRLWPAGTLCITIAANVADAAVLGFDACFPDSVVGFVPASCLGGTAYFQAFLETARTDLVKFAPATAQKNLNLEILGSLFVPLPPKREIERIVARVKELRQLCADLRQRLDRIRTTQTSLADALVDQALAA